MATPLIQSRFLRADPRVIFGSAFLLILFISIAIFTFIIQKPYAVVFSHLKAADAASAVAELDKMKAPYRLGDGGATILAPANQADALRLKLSNVGASSHGVGFEIFNKSDLGLTEFAQKINYQRALQGEIERTLESIDGVVSARVHLTLEEDAAFREDRRPPKASVEITTNSGRPLEPEAVSGIRQTVAAAVPGLAAQNVVIVDGKAHILAESDASRDQVPPLSVKSAIEGFYAARVRAAINGLLPDADFDVRITALQTEPGSQALSDWTPKSRAFPLRAVVETARALTPIMEADVRTRVSSALGTVEDGGDIVILSPRTGVNTPAQSEPRAPQSIGSALVQSQGRTAPLSGGTPTGPSAFWLWALAGSLLVGLVLTAPLVFMSMAPKRLQPEEKAALVSRFKSLLAEDGERAVE